MKEAITRKARIPYVQTPNAILYETTLSLKAKGMWSYLQSKPDSWSFSAERIALECSDGQYAIRQALRELEAGGYIERKKLSDGRMEYRIHLEPNSEKPKQQKPQTAKTAAISNKEKISNKEEESNKENTTAAAIAPPVNVNTFFERTQDKYSGIPMALADFILMCRGSSHRHIRIIGEYADDKRPSCSTRGQWREFGKRNMRAARQLAPYTDAQIAALMDKVDAASKERGGYITKWGLETLIRYLDDV